MIESTQKIVLKTVGVVHTNASESQIKKKTERLKQSLRYFPSLKKHWTV